MRPIADYGLLGDTRTAALVSSDGSLDWLCVPRFDGEPVFGGLVVGAAAGRFRLGPATGTPVADRRYHRHSATLETAWATPHGRLRLTEGMVAEVSGRLLPATLLVRRLSVEGGPCDAVVEFDPRLGEVHRRPRVTRRDSRSSEMSPTVRVVGSGARVARRTSAWTRASSSANANGFVR